MKSKPRKGFPLDIDYSYHQHGAFDFPLQDWKNRTAPDQHRSRIRSAVTVLNEFRAVQDEATQAVEKNLGTWLLQKACSQPSLLALAGQALGPGEAEVIALALELNTMDVVLDDLDARRFARRSGLQPIGTFGLLLAAKRAGIIPAVLPEIEALRQSGFYASDDLVSRILSEAGEQ